MAALVFGVGCAGSAPADAERRFASNPVPLQVDLQAEALGGRRRLHVRAFATCAGPSCVPDRVTLAFVNDGPLPLQGDYRTLRIEADTLARLWDDLRFGGPDQRSVPTGTFLRVEVDGPFFHAMAYAEETHVVLGSTLFRLPHGRRETFRRMVEAMVVR